jgi:hypothetical protein
MMISSDEEAKRALITKYMFCTRLTYSNFLLCLIYVRLLNELYIYVLNKY